MTEPFVTYRCAIYTRKSTGNRLEAEVNSLVTQREICSAYITSQSYKSWVELTDRYDDGGQSGSHLERPALARLMHDIEDGRIDTVVVYKIDRLTRSLVDFVRLIDLFNQRRITLVSVSQAFDTSDSMGRMILNILLTFSQFEREMIGERVRDSMRARKRHGKIHGGKAPFGYQSVDDELVIDGNEAEAVRFMFDEFLRTERYTLTNAAVAARGFRTSVKPLKKGGTRGGDFVSSSTIYAVLQNPIYVGDIHGHDGFHLGRHEPIISREKWEATQKITASRRKPTPRATGLNHFLAGLLQDEMGRPMHVDVQIKGGLTFAYYASADSPWSHIDYRRAYRAHATRLDRLVIAGVADFLGDRIRLRKALKGLGLRGGVMEGLAAAGAEAALRLEATRPGALVEVFSALLVRVELGKEQVGITLRASELKRFLEWRDGTSFMARENEWPLSDATFEFELEVQAVTANRLPSLQLEPCRNPDEGSRSRPLIELVRSARKAQTLVDENRGLSIDELARKLGVRSSQFARLIRVNYLAPDIVAAILDGRQPAALTRKELLSSNIPTDWAVQRRLFGFPAPQREPRVHRDDGLWPRAG